MPKFIIATGGTGGHIFPALILADKLKSKGHECLIVADKRFLNFKQFVPGGLDYKIVMSGLWSGNLLNRLISLVKIEIGALQSMWIMLRYRPKMLISFGGYVSFPAMVAAILLRIPVLAHEQNAIIGKVNRTLLRWISAVAVVFKNTIGLGNFNKQKLYVIPNPVKPAILKIGKSKYPALNKVCVLILGGSQGARVLSQVVPDSIVNLDKKLKLKIEIFQQCRKEDLDTVKDLYVSHGVKATIATFFEDIPMQLAAAHLVICRSGAATVSEVMAAHRPAIFIPLAIAADNHQYLNATMVNVPKKSSWIIEEKNLTTQTLSTLLTELMTKTDLLMQAHDSSKFNAANRKCVDSGEGLVNLIERLI